MMAENIGASLSSNDQNADWQTTKPTIRERNAFMFNNPLMSDVTFVVRASEKNSREIRVPAHKYVLAISSPVFYAMFYGDIAEKNNSIHLPDCHANGFHEFLRFLYSDEVKLTADLVLEVLYLSKKYIVPHLTTKCVEYLAKELNCNNAFEMLKLAKKFDEETLVEKCWEMIDNNTLDCIQSEAMLQVEHDTLESLIKRDTLNVQEVELFKAAKRWAERTCGESDVEATGPEIRGVLGDALFHFRFLEMKPEEFTKNVEATKICLDAESLAVLVSIIDGPSTATDLFPFPKDPRSGFLCNKKRLSGLPLRRCARFSAGSGTGRFTTRSDTLEFKVSSCIILLGIRLYAGNKPHLYDVQVELNDGGTRELQVASNRYRVEQRGRKHPCFGFDVLFNQPQCIRALTMFTIKATIKSVSGDNLMYNNRGARSEVNIDGIQFTFEGESFHILELLFKV